MSAALDRQRVAAVHAAIAPHVRRTPVVVASGADFGLPPFALTLKLEQLQHAGSFKTRGAFANLLLREVPPAGVVAASGGNHGAAVAYAAMRLGVPARIFVPTVSSRAKTERIRSYGADLVIGGDRYADALAASEEHAAATGALPVHAFDQTETLLGQATLARELEEQAPDLDTVLVPVGGGGLIGGIAGWYGGGAGGDAEPAEPGAHPDRAARAVPAVRGVRGVRIVGVEPEAAPTLKMALAAGRPVEAPAGGIAADSLAPRRVGELMLPIAQAHVERVALVSDEAILRAQEALWEALRVVAEPGGAAALAALLAGAYAPAAGERVGVVVSGGNTTAVDLRRAVGAATPGV